MTDEMRAEFEVAFRAQFGFGATDIHDAKDAEAAAMMGCALWAWMASREAVVVGLPERAPNDDPYVGEPWDCGHNVAIDECRKAIEAQGLKVEVAP